MGIWSSYSHVLGQKEGLKSVAAAGNLPSEIADGPWRLHGRVAALGRTHVCDLLLLRGAKLENLCSRLLVSEASHSSMEW